MIQQDVQFTLPYPPSANNYWRALAVKGRAMVVKSSEARQYAEQVKRFALRDCQTPLLLPCAVQVEIYRPRKIGDLDNSLKVLLDALSGIAYDDDSQIEQIHAYRYDDKDYPRAVVSVRPLAGAPVDR